MAPWYKVVKDEMIRPANPPDPPLEVTMAGCDEVYDNINVKLAFFFKELLPAPALKASLAKALDSFPMLAGRMRREGRRSWVECRGHQGGVLVREQVGFFAEGTLRPGSSQALALGSGLCHGPMYTRVNDPAAPVLTVTLTELVYSEGFACRPPAACAILLASAARHSPSSDSSGSDSPRRLDDDEGAGGPRASYGYGDGSAATDDDHRTATIRYALGLSFSHTVVDGCGFSVFLLNWLLAQQHQQAAPLRPAVNERGVLLLEHWAPPPLKKPKDGDDDEDEEEGLEAKEEEEQPVLVGGGGDRPSKFVEVSGLGRAWVLARLLLRVSRLPSGLGLGGCVTVLWSFTYDELEALKNKAMQPLTGSGRWVSTSNSLAAHLWPIISEAWAPHGPPPLLCPLTVVVNSRKALGLPAHYCGNVVSLQAVERASSREEGGAGLTDRALKVRAACVVSVEEVMADHTYMQSMRRQGRIKEVMHGAMRDAVLGRPGLVWDDVSAFSPSTMAKAAAPSGPAPKADLLLAGQGVDLAFAGCRPIAHDVQLADIPGLVFVLSPAPGHNLGGKEVRVCLPPPVAQRLASPSMQGRLHAFDRTHRNNNHHHHSDRRGQ